MCVQTRYIYNPSRYISLRHRDPFSIGVKCGQCVECQRQRFDEWHYRTIAEFQNVCERGGYMFFDTLTYNQKRLPNIKEFCPTISGKGFSCFRRSDLRVFLKSFNKKMSRLRKQYTNVNYSRFIACEYGVDERYTHRPHYHILLFIENGAIPPKLIAQFVHQCWSNGLTDNWHNLRLQGMQYLVNHTYNDFSRHGQQVANYVAKYVQKDSEFQHTLNERVAYLKAHINYDATDPSSRSALKKLINEVNQFILPSQHYGECALRDIDLNFVMDTGMISMPVPSLDMLHHIPIPLYYQRKLFYEQVEVDNKRQWQLTAFGKDYKRASLVRNKEIIKRRFDNFQNSVHMLGLSSYDANIIQAYYSHIDTSQLATYVLEYRGRFKGPMDFATIEQKLQVGFEFYHYGTSVDHDYFGRKFVSTKYYGNDQIGYKVFPDDPSIEMIPRKKFSNLFTYHDSKFDYAIALYEAANEARNSNRQSAFDYLQCVHKKLKRLFES